MRNTIKRGEIYVHIRTYTPSITSVGRGVIQKSKVFVVSAIIPRREGKERERERKRVGNKIWQL